MDEVELLVRLREREARPPGGNAGEEHDVALDDRRRVDAGKRPAPQQRRHLGRAPDHHHGFRPEERLQSAARTGHDRLQAPGRGVEQHVAAGDERANVAAARAREGVAQRVLLHDAAARHVHGAQQRDVARAIRRVAPRVRCA